MAGPSGPGSSGQGPSGSTGPEEGLDRPRVILRVVPPPPPEPPPARRLSWRDGALAAVLVIGVLGLGHAIITRGLADARLEKDPASASRLRPDDPDALRARADAILESTDHGPESLARAADLSRDALRLDPLQGASYRNLAIVRGLTGDRANENRLMTIAGQRRKRDVAVGLWLMDNRTRAGRLAEAVDVADGLLRAWPVSMRTRVGEQLSTIAGLPGGAPVLARALDEEPPWRPGFLAGMARSGDNTGAAVTLFTTMSAGRHPPTETETSALVSRLVKDGDYPLAFLVWAQLLPAEGIARLADPYDGEFNGLPGGPPFNWVLYPKGGTVVEMAPRNDGDGTALYLRFSGGKVAGPLARQLLALPPGTHRLSGRWQGSGLSSSRPLTWTLICANLGQKMSATGPALSGSTGWAPFDMTFEVPPACTAQWLMLTAEGRGSMDGEAWFDGLTISR
jgi:hypothetical protein